MKFKEIFTTYLDFPHSEREEKMQFVGFIMAISILGVILLPEAILAQFLRDVTLFSNAWVACFGALITWPIIFYFTLEDWLKFSQNFGILMYLNYEKDQAKKKRKQEQVKKLLESIM